MDIFQTIEKRKSIRSYSEKVVSNEIIEKVISAGRDAPTSCNLQLTEYIIVNDSVLKSILAKKITGKFNWAPTFIIFLYDSRFAIKRSAAVVSLGAAMQNINLASTALGLVTCPMAGFNEDKTLKKILNIPEYYNVGLIMSIGYDSNTEKKIDTKKRSISSIYHYNLFNKPKDSLNDSLDLNKWSFKELVSYRSRLAPVYFYPGRYNLSTYDPAQYSDVYKTLSTNIDLTGKDLIDLFSYDCSFAKVVAEKNDIKTIAVSDIIEHTLKTFEVNFPSTKKHLFTSFNKLHVDDMSYDVATFVHKAEFTPKINNVLKEVHRILKPGGILFTVTTYPSIALRIADWFRSFKIRFKGSTMNVYEHNKFYKIGPVKYLASNLLDMICKKEGFVKKKSGSERVGNKIFYTNRYWALYDKK